MASAEIVDSNLLSYVNQKLKLPQNAQLVAGETAQGIFTNNVNAYLNTEIIDLDAAGIAANALQGMGQSASIGGWTGTDSYRIVLNHFDAKGYGKVSDEQFAAASAELARALKQNEQTLQKAIAYRETMSQQLSAAGVEHEVVRNDNNGGTIRIMYENPSDVTSAIPRINYAYRVLGGLGEAVVSKRSESDPRVLEISVSQMQAYRDNLPGNTSLADIITAQRKEILQGAGRYESERVALSERLNLPVEFEGERMVVRGLNKAQAEDLAHKLNGAMADITIYPNAHDSVSGKDFARTDGKGGVILDERFFAERSISQLPATANIALNSFNSAKKETDTQLALQKEAEENNALATTNARLEAISRKAGFIYYDKDNADVLAKDVNSKFNGAGIAQVVADDAAYRLTLKATKEQRAQAEALLPSLEKMGMEQLARALNEKPDAMEQANIAAKALGVTPSEALDGTPVILASELNGKGQEAASALNSINNDYAKLDAKGNPILNKYAVDLGTGIGGGRNKELESAALAIKGKKKPETQLAAVETQPSGGYYNIPAAPIEPPAAPAASAENAPVIPVEPAPAGNSQKPGPADSQGIGNILANNAFLGLAAAVVGIMAFNEASFFSMLLVGAPLLFAAVKGDKDGILSGVFNKMFGGDEPKKDGDSPAPLLAHGVTRNPNIAKGAQASSDAPSAPLDPQIFTAVRPPQAMEDGIVSKNEFDVILQRAGIKDKTLGDISKSLYVVDGGQFRYPPNHTGSEITPEPEKKDELKGKRAKKNTKAQDTKPKDNVTPPQEDRGSYLILTPRADANSTGPVVYAQLTDAGALKNIQISQDGQLLQVQQDYRGVGAANVDRAAEQILRDVENKSVPVKTLSAADARVDNIAEVLQSTQYTPGKQADKTVVKSQ